MGCFSLHLLKACSAGATTVKVMTVEGRCLRFDAPIIVKEVLMEYPCHALFLSDSVRSLGDRARPLHSTTSLQPGYVYFLIPQPAATMGSRPACSAASMETSSAPAASLATSARSKSRRKVSFATPAAADSAPSCRPMFEDRDVDDSSDAGSMASFDKGAVAASIRKSAVEFLPSPSEGVLRLKMVVSKKQLASVLREGGDYVSMVEGLLSPLLVREADQSTAAAAAANMSYNVSWRPALQSIPETTSCAVSR